MSDVAEYTTPDEGVVASSILIKEASARDAKLAKPS
jgi:hypothetical protein